MSIGNVYEPDPSRYQFLMSIYLALIGSKG